MSLVVVKIGSSTLVDSNGALDRDFIRSLCEQVTTLVARGTRVVVVSSGAAAAGRDVLGFSERPSDMATLQACASAGQARLTQAYADVLAERGIPCGQVLLTRRDVMDRDGFLNARTTLLRLLELGAVPVVNENDTVSTAEFAFGDNDMLGALVSALVGADLYVICSDVDGLYTANPQEDPTATLIERVEEVDHRLSEMAGGAGTSFGTGGMSSKLRAARAMLAAGIPTVICRGRRPGVLVDVASGRASEPASNLRQVPLTRVAESSGSGSPRFPRARSRSTRGRPGPCSSVVPPSCRLASSARWGRTRRVTSSTSVPPLATSSAGAWRATPPTT